VLNASSTSRATAFGSAVSIGLVQSQQADSNGALRNPFSDESTSGIVLDGKFPETDEDMIHNSDNGLLDHLDGLLSVGLADGSKSRPAPIITIPKMRPESSEPERPPSFQQLANTSLASLQNASRPSSKSSRLTKLSSSTAINKNFASLSVSHSLQEAPGLQQGSLSRFQTELLGSEVQACMDGASPRMPGCLAVTQTTSSTDRVPYQPSMSKKLKAVADEARWHPRTSLEVVAGPKKSTLGEIGTSTKVCSVSTNDTRFAEMANSSSCQIPWSAGGDEWEDELSDVDLGPYDDSEGEEQGEEEQGDDVCWHDIKAVPITDPVSGKEVG